MNSIILIICTPILLYLGLSVLYQFALAVISIWANEDTVDETDDKNLLIVVPAYKEDDVILKSVEQNLIVDYPKERFTISVIADSMKQKTLELLREMGAEITEVSFDKSTKVKALKAFIEYNSLDQYDGVILLDADNIMQKDFLKKSSSLLNNNAKMVQGLRTAMGIHNASSLYDAIAERANHKMLCEAANMLGMSGKLSGSGMLMTTDLFLSTIPRLTAVGGFDKEMELILTKESEFIQYNSKLLVFDEKTDNFQTFSKQRGRWLESQYSFFKRYFKSAFQALAKGNIDHFHKVMQLALPPRALMPVALLILGLAFLLSGNEELFWACANLVQFNILTYLILTPSEWLEKHGLKLIISTPTLIFSTLKALSFMSKSGKEFIHTKKKIHDYAV